MAEPQIRYTRTKDGADIAYAVIGHGKPLLVARPLFQAAVDDELAAGDAPFVTGLAGTRSIVIWDHRGTGLSSGPAGFSLESSIADMEAIVEALQLKTFDLLGMLSPGHTAIAYAARHPDHVKRMVLWNIGAPGASPRSSGWKDLPDIAATHFREYMQLAALRAYGWDNGPAARRFVERMTANFTPESWEATNRTMETVDASELAGEVAAETMVIIDIASAMRDFLSPDRQAYLRRLSAAIPQCELVVIRGGKQFSWIDRVRTFLEAGEDAQAEPPDVPPSGTAVILFTDIVDSTPLTERMGDAAFRAASRAIEDGIRAAMRDAGGSPVEGKVLGDGVMGLFASASQAITAAQACVELGAHAEAGSSTVLPLHIGLHAGDVIREGTNVYGGAVNLASRICGLCAPGEILVSATVRDLARTSAGVMFEDRGEQALKGIEEAVRVYAVRWLA